MWTFYEAYGSGTTVHEIYWNWMPAGNDAREVVDEGSIAWNELTA